MQIIKVAKRMLLFDKSWLDLNDFFYIMSSSRIDEQILHLQLQIMESGRSGDFMVLQVSFVGVGKTQCRLHAMMKRWTGAQLHYLTIRTEE